MGDFFDDFDDFDDGDFMDEEPGTWEDDPDDSGDASSDGISAGAESKEGFEPDWEDLALFGALSEEMAQERRERRRLMREVDRKKRRRP